MSRSSKGFALLEAVAIVGIVGLIALVGVKVYGSHKDKSAATTNSQSQQSAAATVPQVKTSADLDKASQVLDQNDPTTANSNDSAQLDRDSSAF